MSRSRPIVAIDGPAGAGKSSTAKALAEKLGFVLVDTGALYRAVALAADEAQVAWTEGAALGNLAASLKLEFRRQSGENAVFINGIDRSREIRAPHISEGASQVSAHPAVRDALLGVQRQLGAAGGVVMEGRDIATVVFPDAEVKIFLTASAEKRARRRELELCQRGIEVDYEETLSDIRHRDRRDSERAVAPLRACPESTVVDSTDLSFNEVVDRLVALVR